VKAICEGNKINEPETYCTDINLHKRGKLHADVTEEILICVVLGDKPGTQISVHKRDCTH
jgi:hypothetical protein